MSAPAPSVLNLIYHVYPCQENELWKWNLQQVLRRWDVFTGRRLLAIAVDGDAQRAERMESQVREVVAGKSCEIIVKPNDQRLRETASFGSLLRLIANTRDDEATFYGHTKGNTSIKQGPGVGLWTSALYHYLLDQPEVIKGLLRSFALVGGCKLVWKDWARCPFPTKLRVSHGDGWIFGGGFFWFRHSRVFAAAGWDAIAEDRFGAEAWPNMVANETDAASVYQPWPPEQLPSLYPAESHGEYSAFLLRVANGRSPHPSWPSLPIP